MSVNFYITSLVIFLAVVSCDRCKNCGSCKHKSEKKSEAVTQQESTPEGVIKVANWSGFQKVLKNNEANKGVMVVFFSKGNKECDWCYKYNDKEYNEKFEGGEKLGSTFSDLVEKYSSSSIKFYKVVLLQKSDENKDREYFSRHISKEVKSEGIKFPAVAVYKDGELKEVTQEQPERNKLLDRLAQYIEKEGDNSSSK